MRPQCREGALHIFQDADLVLEGIGDDSFFIDYVCNPPVAESEPATGFVETGDLFVRVRDQGKRQVVFLPEACVALGGVRADSRKERAG